MKNSETYQPISCDYYDELILVARGRAPCQVSYKDQGGVTQTIVAKIQDIFTRNKEEFLLLSTGLEIRLDQIVHVNGIYLEGYGAC